MNFLQRKNRNPQQNPPSGNTQNTSTNPLKTAADSLKNAAEKTKEVLTNTVQAVANLFRVEYDLAVPDNEALCETIELETAINTTHNLNFKELCDTELVACCENPEYRVFSQPNNGGTLTILDPVLGTATYKPKKGFIGKECFVVEIACDDDDYNTHLKVCVKVGACACSPLRYSIGEDCTLCETIDCQIANPKQPNAAKQYELVANSVVGGTATVSTNGQLEFTPLSGAIEANFQVLIKQGCDKCCIDIFVDITSVCEPCEHELSWDTCANQTPPIFDLPICNFCNCHCPEWSAVASAGEFAWVKDANGKDTTQWTITPPSQFAGVIKVTFTATCYDKTTVTTSCTIDVNHCCDDYAIEWGEGCNIANTVSFEYNCGTCESGCKNAQFVAQNVPEGVTVSLAPISNSSVFVTVTTSGARDIEFDIVSTCSNKPGACYGHVIITDEYCPNNWTRISGKCLPTCDPDDPNCGCPEGYFNVAGICFELCDPNAKKECNQCADGFTHVTLLLADGSTVCVCLPTDECPTGWVHVNGLCLPTCVNGVCPDGFICINGICLPLCVNGNCPDGFAPVTLDINGVATCVCFPECVDGNCPTGFVCVGTLCLPECVDGVCPAGMICINGICLPLCVDGNCPNGFASATITVNGVNICVCLPECVDGNCPEGFECLGGLCLPECVNGECPEGFYPQTIQVDGVDVCVCHLLCPVTLTTFAVQTFNGSVGNSVNSTIPKLNAACSGTEIYNLSNATNNLPAGVTFGVNGSNATLTATSDSANVGSFAIQNVEVLCDNVLVGTTTFNINIAPTVTTKPSRITTDASGTWQCTNGTMTGQLTITSVEPIPPTSTLQVASGYANTTYGVPVANAADYTVNANGLITVINEVSTLVLDITFANPNCADMPSIILGISNANYPPNTLTWGGHNANGGAYVATSNIPTPFVKGNKGDYIIYGGFAPSTPTDGSLQVYYGTSVNGSAFNNTTPVAFDGNQTSATVLTPFANGNYLQVCLTDGTNTVCDKKRVPLPKIDEVISATDIVYSLSNLAPDTSPNFKGSGFSFYIKYTDVSGVVNSADLQYDSSGNTLLNTLPTFAMPDIANNTVTLNIAAMLAVGIVEIEVTLAAKNEYHDTAIISSVGQVIDTWNSSNCGGATFTPILTFAQDVAGGDLVSLDVQATGLTNAATLEAYISPNNNDTSTSPSSSPFSYNLNDPAQYANFLSTSPYTPTIFVDAQTEAGDVNNWLVLRVTDGACVYYVIIWYGEFILCTDPTNAIKYIVVSDINSFDPATTPMSSVTIDTTPICI